jgi:hypothetical protein
LIHADETKKISSENNVIGASAIKDVAENMVNVRGLTKLRKNEFVEIDLASGI